MLFDLVNLPYWILLAMGVLLFLVVILSGGMDEDLDLDSGADMDGPADLDTDLDEAFSLGQVMGWLGIGKAPLILLLATDLSLMGVIGWMLNVFLRETFPQLADGLIAGVVLVFAVIGALWLGSLLARPLGQVFVSFGEDVSPDRLIGCVGTVSSAVIPPLQEKRIGQVDVLDAARNRVTVHAMLPDWATVTPRLGDRVLVIDRQSENYLVVLKDSPDQDRWFSLASRSEKSLS